MAIRFLHTADLQIGARYLLFGERARRLRQARVEALCRLLDLAADRRLDAVLIAGDLFESNQLSDREVAEVYAAMAARSAVPLFILPGNHDPCSGPGCIWLRAPFRDPPPHVTVFREPAGVPFGPSVLLAVPLTQKQSAVDPSLPLTRMAAEWPAERIKVGITHGSLRIEGKHAPNDHPIALDAASRAGLDYLALGHWHTSQVLDGGRLVMPGTPEPDQFGQGPGRAVVVEIAAPGDPPRLEFVETGLLRWHAVELNGTGRGPDDPGVRAGLDRIDTPPERTVLRITISGRLTVDTRKALDRDLQRLTEDVAAVVVDDRSRPTLSEGQWRARLAEHPLLARVVEDIERARGLATGEGALPEEDPQALSTADLQALCRAARIASEDADGGLFDEMLILVAAETARILDEDAHGLCG